MQHHVGRHPGSLIAAARAAVARWWRALRGPDAAPAAERDERALLRTLIDLMPDYIYAKDAEGRFVLANRAVANVMGAESPQALIGKSDADFYPPELAAAFRADEQPVLGAGLSLRDREELGVNRTTGESRWHLSTKVPVHDAQGRVVGLVGITRDIHQRKQAEEEIQRLNVELDQRVKERTAELAAERKLLRTLVDNMPDLIYAKDSESRFILANPAVGESMGVTPAQLLLGRTDFDCYEPEQAQRFFDDERRIITSGESLIGREEEALDHRSGTQRWLLSTKVPLRDDEGRVVGLIGISRDFTELRRIREELTQHRDRLQELVEERTEELRIAKERAEAANEAKSRFLANMSHELRTPLNAVLGYAQILKRENGLSERQVVGLDTIQHSGEHLLMLIEDVLDLAKVEAGKLELVTEVVVLADFLRVIEDIIRVKAEDKHLGFVSTVPPDLPAAVRVDEQRLRQMLLNLLSNAVKFTERGRVSLHVSRVPREGPNAHLRFEVEDTGCGIPREQHEAIFRPFEQAGSVEGRFGGTGLGLAISRQLARVMGSEIRVDSEPGRGSLFWFELDLPVVQEGATPSPSPRPFTGYAGPRKRVLVADDVIGNRALLTELLASLGFEVIEAQDGQALLAQAQAHSPDLLITDVVMPTLDGLEAVRRLRRMPAFAALPVLAVSAHVSGEEEARSLAAGVNVFLRKPVDIERLLQHVGELLGLRWTRVCTSGDDDDHASELLFAPSVEELDTLHRLARFGHMRSIREHADRLSEHDERLRPFAERLRWMADRFESRSIADLIERYRKPG
jgi:PAS domain S-box-containing protein